MVVSQAPVEAERIIRLLSIELASRRMACSLASWVELRKDLAEWRPMEASRRCCSRAQRGLPCKRDSCKSIFNGTRISWANRVILIFFFGKITVVSVNGLFLWLGRLQFLFASVIIYGKICKYFRGREIA